MEIFEKIQRFLHLQNRSRNGRWTEPAEAEDVEAEAKELQEDGQMGR